MRNGSVGQARYRARQFFAAILASAAGVSDAEEAEIRSHLSSRGWHLFRAMPRADQRHSLSVLRSVQTTGHADPALVQAALLHDCAKLVGGVRIWHRVAVVLLKAFRPEWLDRWTATEPVRSSWRYPLWMQINHPARGAELAKAAGCDPMAVALIAVHQECPGEMADPRLRELLAALQAADDDN